MKLYLLGNTNDEKGSQLEKITRRILEAQGFSDICMNVQGSGGNEIDVRASLKNKVGAKTTITPVICECKAHAKPIDTTDWLKFVGKFYLEKKRNPSALGIMVSLSGANGNVVGSYQNEITEQDGLQLLVNDDLISVISECYNLPSSTAIRENFQNAHRRNCFQIDLVYFKDCIRFLLNLGAGEFTLCSDVGACETKENVTDWLKMLEAQSEFSSSKYVDVRAKEEQIRIRALVESCIYQGIFAADLQDINDFSKHIRDSQTQENIPDSVIREIVSQSEFFNLQGSTISICYEDKITFLRHLFEIGLNVDTFGSPKFQQLLDSGLVDNIKKLQYNIILSAEDDAKLLFLIKHSPNALLYTLYPIGLLNSFELIYKTNNTEMIRLYVNSLFQKLIAMFKQDFENQSMHKLYFEVFKISQIKTESNLVITHNDYPIEFNLSQNLMLVAAEGISTPLLIASI